MTDRIWFDDARLGLFIHWGLYSIPARGEWLLFKERVPKEDYNALAAQFRPPASFSPEAWVVLAKEAGAKYVVFTTRHHDGFSLYDSAVNPFNSARTAAGRDFVAEYVAACRKHGLRVGLYYSIMNWQHDAIHTGPVVDPAGWAAMVDETHAQLRELLSRYGKIDLLWYDGDHVPGGGDNAACWRSAELNAMARALQPDILINDRSHLPEDFDTPEQEISIPPAGRRWEACMTLNDHWGYVEGDENFKSPEMLWGCLLRCARFGGNLLLNIGPRADGSVPGGSAEALRTLGRWLDRNGAAIYASERTPYTEANHLAGTTTQRDRAIYLHPAASNASRWRLDGVSRAARARELSSGRPVPIIDRQGHAILLENPGGAVGADACPAVVAVELDGPADAPASMLMDVSEIVIEPGDTPVLAVASPAQEALPEGERRVGAALAAIATDGGAVDPAWEADNPEWLFPVYARTPGGGVLEFNLDVGGVYDIQVGVMTRRPGRVGISLNGAKLGEPDALMNPHCPDTIVRTGVELPAGATRLALASEVEAGVYALQLRPRWRPIPTGRWQVMGPFPSGYDPRKQDDSVRRAMEVVLGPEVDPSLEAVRKPCGAVATWRALEPAQENPDDHAVDFVKRCGDGKGVAFARTVVESAEERLVAMAIATDWWADVFVNGERMSGRASEGQAGIQGCGFSTCAFTPFTCRFKAGANVIVVKNHGGRGGGSFRLHLHARDAGELEPC